MKRIILAILVLIWMLVVFYFSSENATKSAGTSGEIIETIIEIFAKEISKEEKQEIIEKLQPIIRKCAHLTLYAVGGILIFLFINTYKMPLKNKIIYAIIIGGIYAITDEIHQAFVPGRGPGVLDVLIDTVGVTIGSTATSILSKTLKQK